MKEVTEIATIYFNKDDAKFTAELKLMIGKKEGEKRLSQLDGCKRLASYYEDAQLMLVLKSSLNLSDGIEF